MTKIRVSYMALAYTEGAEETRLCATEAEARTAATLALLARPECAPDAPYTVDVVCVHTRQDEPKNTRPIIYMPSRLYGPGRGVFHISWGSYVFTHRSYRINDKGETYYTMTREAGIA